METLEALSSTIETTEEIGSIVRTMKAVSAVSIRQYDQAVLSLKDFHRTIELGLQVVLRDERTEIQRELEREGRTAAIVFGSDRGLCGGFNRSVVDLAAGELGRATKAAEAPSIVAVGARAAACLEGVGLPPTEVFFLPGSVAGLAQTAQSILIQADRWREEDGVATIRDLREPPYCACPSQTDRAHAVSDPDQLYDWPCQTPLAELDSSRPSRWRRVNSYPG